MNRLDDIGAMRGRKEFGCTKHRRHMHGFLVFVKRSFKGIWKRAMTAD